MGLRRGAGLFLVLLVTSHSSAWQVFMSVNVVTSFFFAVCDQIKPYIKLYHFEIEVKQITTVQHCFNLIKIDD